MFLTWLPVSFVYVSERYLYLPSVGIAGMAGLALARIRLHRDLGWVSLFVMLAWMRRRMSVSSGACGSDFSRDLAPDRD